MLYYIIKTVSKWTDKKTGEEIKLESYYHHTAKVMGLYFNNMCGEKEAKQFDCKSEAKRTAAKLFAKGRYEIVKIETI